MLTKSLASDYAEYNIRVNAIAPSVFKSKMAKKMDKKIKQKFLENSSTKKEIKLKSVIDLIDSLSSRDSKEINGQIIRLDNGLKL